MMSRSDAPALLSPSYDSPEVSAPSPSDREHAEVLVLEIARGGHAERGRDRGGGVPGAEHVVLALVALEEARNAALLPQRLESIAAAREQLVRIRLVSDVPHELVARRVEHVVQRHRELDHAESGADVTARARADVDERRTHFVAHGAQLSRVSDFRSAGKLTRRKRHRICGQGMKRSERAPGRQRRAQLVRAIAYLASISSVAVLSPARSSAAHASSTSAAARSIARSTPSSIGYVLLRSSTSRPAVLPRAAVVDVASSTSSAI